MIFLSRLILQLNSQEMAGVSGLESLKRAFEWSALIKLLVFEALEVGDGNEILNATLHISENAAIECI